MNLLEKIWTNIKKNAQTQQLTRRQEVFQELSRGEGTARQVSDRMGLRLTIVRTYLTTLHRQALIEATGDMVGREQVWRVKD
jgi:DNA-binding CsgD family transcriptional regulator